MGYFLCGIWCGVVWWPFMFLLGRLYQDKKVWDD
jgi:hypothetical protein